MTLTVEIDEKRCTKPCPYITARGGEIQIMVGGGLCYICNYHRGSGKDPETGDFYVICSKEL